MPSKKADIPQIEKYLKGGLNGPAMHQLEHEAQSDPFLMDALDGFEAAGGIRQASFDDLDRRLQQRLNESKVRRLNTWKYYAAAASVLIVFTLGYLLWPAGQKSEVKQQVALKVDHTPASATDKVTPPVNDAQQSIAAVINPAPVVKKEEFKQAAAKSSAPPTIRIDEPVGNADSKAVTDESIAEAAPPKPANAAYEYSNSHIDSVARIASMARMIKNDSAQTLNEITIPGRTKLQQKDLSAKTAAAPQTLQSKVAGADVTTPTKKVSGTILSELGLPLPGVLVTGTGTDKRTQTDANGRFSLPTNGQSTIDVKSIGYEAKRVYAKNDEDLNIKLKENTSALAEVVITHANKKPIKKAHPQMGWDNYQKYIKAHAIATKAGKVQLSFTVGTNGQLGDFKVIKGLDEAINQQAIELIKNGPAWAPDISSQTKTIKLKIYFSKE